LAHLKRIRLGRRSESLDAQQLDLFAESVDEDIGSIHAVLDTGKADEVTAPRKPRQHAGRQPLPDHLPRIEFRHEPESCQCGACGKDLVKIGEDISEQLDVTPAIFTVHRHIRPQYACRACETVTAAPIPPAVIDGGLATPGLFSWVVISKYADHLPLYRLEQMAEREGVSLARSTLADWVGRVGYALEPLHERLKEHLLQGGVLHADETLCSNSILEEEKPIRRTSGLSEVTRFTAKAAISRKRRVMAGRLLRNRKSASPSKSQAFFLASLRSASFVVSRFQRLPTLYRHYQKLLRSRG
jgi:transposase